MDRIQSIIGIRELVPHQEELVRDALRSIVESPHFRKSKRYPALLEYVVCNTLDGHLEVLKERVIGGEVFGRSADYDTSTDPVVRMAAGEVRKRMALYFSEHPEAEVRIDLPVGSYVAEFRFPLAPAQNDRPAPSRIRTEEAQDIPEPGPLSRQTLVTENASRNRVWLGMLAAVLLVLGGGVATWLYVHANSQKDQFWSPVLHENIPAVVVLGGGPDPALEAAIAGSTTGADAHPLLTGNAVATAQICNIFGANGRTCKVLPSQSAKLEDLRNKSVVLVGAFDNEWTQRLLAPYRFQFRFSGPATAPPPRPRMIIDSLDAQNSSEWEVGAQGPSPELGSEYAIVGRFRSDMTDAPVVIVAGLGPEGTSGAAEFISAPETYQSIVAHAPKSWKGFNFEAVLKIDVVKGSTGRIKVLDTQFW